MSTLEFIIFLLSLMKNFFFVHKCNTWNSFYTWVANDPIFAVEESECNAIVDEEEGGGWGVNPDVEDDEVTPAEFTYTE